MELNEALRRIVTGHWRLLLLFTLLPVLIIGALQVNGKPGYTASARVQASSTPPSTTTEADAVLNRAQGFATSTTAVQEALQQAQITNRSVAEMVHEVDVTRIGASAMLNVTVTDRDPRVATATDSALAPHLVSLLNGSATVVSLPSGAQSARASLGTDLGLGALLGLVAGLLVATVLEVVRPRVADAGAFGREIGAPLLGHLVLQGGKKQPRLSIPLETLVVAKRAVAHGRIETVVLTGPDLNGQLPLIALQLENHLTSGSSPMAEVMEQPTWNGKGPSGGGPIVPVSVGGSHGPAPVGQAQTLEALSALKAADPGLPRPLRVLALSDVDDVTDSCRHGLLVLVPDLARDSEARRIRHLTAATGWPAIGVLGTSRSRRRVHYEESRLP
ncbi:capsular polysaccharide biosynthesis protein [Streptomyces sp. 846.5]|nr:hypothetical protein [Streptomyces sp. 846.5]TDT94110.1 capsular polysaccharide biosynthesis protein [Streptomyces sp. 846.5]